MPRYDSVYPALKWQHNRRGFIDMGPSDLADLLEIEELPYEEIPEHIYPNVKHFRKLRQEDRYRVARRFLQELRDAKLAKRMKKQIDKATSEIFPEFDLSTLREEVERVRVKALTDIDTDPLDLAVRGNFQLALAALDQARTHLDLAALTQTRAIAKQQLGR